MLLGCLIELTMVLVICHQWRIWENEIVLHDPYSEALYARYCNRKIGKGGRIFGKNQNIKSEPHYEQHQGDFRCFSAFSIANS